MKQNRSGFKKHTKIFRIDDDIVRFLKKKTKAEKKSEVMILHEVLREAFDLADPFLSDVSSSYRHGEKTKATRN